MLNIKKSTYFALGQNAVLVEPLKPVVAEFHRFDRLNNVRFSPIAKIRVIMQTGDRLLRKLPTICFLNR